MRWWSRGPNGCGGDAGDGCVDGGDGAAPTTPPMSLMSEAAFVVIDLMYWQNWTVGRASRSR